MGLPMLPDELMLSLVNQWPCRDVQLRQLAALLSPSLPSPSPLVVHGSHATGKTSVVRSYLQSSKLLHVVVSCRECVTARQLLERTVAAVWEVLRSPLTDGTAKEPPSRCENIAALAVHLQRLLRNSAKFVLVFDGVDTIREAPLTLLPALARMAETVPQLTVVLIVQHPAPRFLHQVGISHVLFSPYSRSQSIKIVSQTPPNIFHGALPEELDYDDEVHDEDKAWLWPRFCAAVWDALAEHAARDLVGFRDVCHRLWRPFVAPIVAGDFGTRDFSRLLVAQRKLFQGEDALLDSIIPSSGWNTNAARPSVKVHEMPYYTKWLLVAAYLASFNSTKTDALYFMKSTERKRRKKGGGTARSGGRPSKIRKIPRHLLTASAFTLDRLLSILHAVLPDSIRTTVNIYKQIATLLSLRLLVRAGGIGGGDVLEPGGKWRVGPMVSWEYIQSLARSLDFDIVDYVSE